MNKEKPESNHSGARGRRTRAGFRALTQEISHYSSQHLLKRDFLPRVAKRLLEFSGCDELELRVKAVAPEHFRCRVRRANGIQSEFQMVAHPLGAGGDSPPEAGEDPEFERLCRGVIQSGFDLDPPCMTANGSFWTGDLEQTLHAGLPRTDGPRVDASRIEGAPRSLALIPLLAEDQCVGLLVMKSRKKAAFTEGKVAFYEDVSHALVIALARQNTQIALRERIKELTCLYAIAQVIARPGASFDEIMHGIVELLPPAWLYPDVAAARIELDGKSYATPGFRETPYRQTSDIVVNGERVGFVEVAYADKQPELDEGPFLREERSLIDSVAREVALFFERRRSEDEKSLLQEQLRHADRLATIGQLAAGVAHELNEPLGNILGFAQLARRSPDLPEQALMDVDKIISASLHAREIIKKLMVFARELPARMISINLNKVVEDGIYFFEARCAKLGIELVRDLSPDLPAITGDPGQLNQVLVNLLVNAVQAMPEGGTLTVVTRVEDGHALLIVEDTGEGMSEEVQKQIFIPFFTTKDVDEGTGLGLPVVHGIVASHKGSVHVKSRAGAGARFEIRLPLTERAAVEERD